MTIFTNFYKEKNNSLKYLNIGTISQKIPIYIKNLIFYIFLILDSSIQGIYNNYLSNTYNFIKQENDYTIYFQKLIFHLKNFILINLMITLKLFNQIIIFSFALEFHMILNKIIFLVVWD